MSESDNILLLAEKRIAFALYGRVLGPHIAPCVLSALYHDETRQPLFLDEPEEQDEVNETCPLSIAGNMKFCNVDDMKWARIDVTNLQTESWTGITLPPFQVRLVQRNGQEIVLNPKRLIQDIRVRISVYNKWVDVSREVLVPRIHLMRTLENGRVTISDMTFVEVSHKHGGYFQIAIQPVDYTFEILEWRSVRIIVHARKTLNRKRRDSDTE